MGKLLHKTLHFNREKFYSKIVAYLFVFPAFFVIAAVIIYPIIQSFVMSFQQIDLLNYSQREFVGLRNYIEIFKSPTFTRSLKLTLMFVAVVVPIQSFISLMISILLHRIKKGKTFFRAGLFVPYITSTVAVTMVFMRLFTKNGPLTLLFTKLGFANVTWFANMKLAFPFLSTLYIWKNFGFYVLLFMNGLNTISPELYEAAEMDGANGLRKFYHITLPMLRPFLLLVFITEMIDAFKVFDEIYVLSRGGSLGSPAGSMLTLVAYIYAQAFRYNNLGYGAASSVVLLVFVWLVTTVLRRSFSDEIS